MPQLEPSLEDRVRALEADIAALKQPAHPSDSDRLIIRVALLFLACFVGSLVYRSVVKDEKPNITDYMAIAGGVALLRTDKATSSEISTGLLRRVLGISE